MKTPNLFLILYPILTLIANPIVNAQQREGFEIIKLIEATPIKNQQWTGTCWSFASTSFIESEAIRLGKESAILSPIFYVPPTYISKAEKFIESKGKSRFARSDLTFSVMDAYKKHGAIPEKIYNGMPEGESVHNHHEMDNLLYAAVKSIGASGYRHIKPYSWKKSIEGILEAYLGAIPDSFIYNGNFYNSKSFASEMIGINPDNYIVITSYKHNPFYSEFILDIPDQSKISFK